MIKYTFAKYYQSNSNSFMDKSQNPNRHVFDNIRYRHNASETFTLI